MYRLLRPRYVELRRRQNLHHTRISFPALAQSRFRNNAREIDSWAMLIELIYRALVPRPTPPACSVSFPSTRDCPVVPPPSSSPQASSRDTSTATSTARTLRLCVRLSQFLFRWSGLALTSPDAALVHVIGTMILLGYAQNYYFHLRTSHLDAVQRKQSSQTDGHSQVTTRTTLTRWDNGVETGSMQDGMDT